MSAHDTETLAEVLTRAEADLRLAVDELCPHGPEDHAEGTCEICDTAFAVDSEIQEAFTTLAARIVQARAGEGALRETLTRVAWSSEAALYRDEACRHVVAQPYADNRYVRLLDDLRAALTTADPS